MYGERLEVLETLLREDAATPTGAMFDLGIWVGHRDAAGIGSTYGSTHGSTQFDPVELGLDPAELRERAHFLPGVPQDKLPKMSCGTTGCALGLAMISGRFAQWGLTGAVIPQYSGGVVLIPMCNGQDGYEAGAELFDISVDDSRYLFDPDSYASTPQEAEGEIFVADRIRDFINGAIDGNYHPDFRDEV